jgi:hypothetical protein
MSYTGLKKIGITLALAVGFVVSPSLSSFSAVQAQGWRNDQFRRNDRWDDRFDSRWERQREREGFRDGFEHGRRDALRGRRFDVDYDDFRERNHDYRQGFRKGYIVGYREFSRRRY